MEALRKELSKKYDIPGAEPDHQIRLGIPKDHPKNPFYPGISCYYYACSLKEWWILEPERYPDNHWDYRGVPIGKLSYSLNPHELTHTVVYLGLCLPLFQRNFRTVLWMELAPEIFDNLQPMRMASSY